MRRGGGSGGGKSATMKAYSKTRPYTTQGADSKDVTGRLSYHGL